MSDEEIIEFDAVKKAKQLVEEYGGVASVELGRASGARAAKYIVETLKADFEALDMFAELLRAADAEVFRARLLELHKEALADFDRRYPGERE